MITLNYELAKQLHDLGIIIPAELRKLNTDSFTIDPEKPNVSLPNMDEMLMAIPDSIYITGQYSFLAMEMTPERKCRVMYAGEKYHISPTYYPDNFVDALAYLLIKTIERNYCTVEQINELIKNNYAKRKQEKVEEIKLTVSNDIRIFPMLDGPNIVWSTAEKIYKYYSALFGTKQSLEQIAQRGGFGWSEVVYLIGECKRRNKKIEDK